MCCFVIISNFFSISIGVFIQFYFVCFFSIFLFAGVFISCGPIDLSGPPYLSESKCLTIGVIVQPITAEACVLAVIGCTLS